MNRAANCLSQMPSRSDVRQKYSIILTMLGCTEEQLYSVPEILKSDGGTMQV